MNYKVVGTIVNNDFDLIGLVMKKDKGKIANSKIADWDVSPIELDRAKSIISRGMCSNFELDVLDSIRPKGSKKLSDLDMYSADGNKLSNEIILRSIIKSDNENGEVVGATIYIPALDKEKRLKLSSISSLVDYTKPLNFVLNYSNANYYFSGKGGIKISDIPIDYVPLTLREPDVVKGSRNDKREKIRIMASLSRILDVTPVNRNRFLFGYGLLGVYFPASLRKEVVDHFPTTEYSYNDIYSDNVNKSIKPCYNFEIKNIILEGKKEEFLREPKEVYALLPFLENIYQFLDYLKKFADLYNCRIIIELVEEVSFQEENDLIPIANLSVSDNKLFQSGIALIHKAQVGGLMYLAEMFKCEFRFASGCKKYVENLQRPAVPLHFENYAENYKGFYFSKITSVDSDNIFSVMKMVGAYERDKNSGKISDTFDSLK